MLEERSSSNEIQQHYCCEEVGYVVIFPVSDEHQTQRADDGENRIIEDVEISENVEETRKQFYGASYNATQAC